MTFVAIDSETHLIQDGKNPDGTEGPSGLLAPPLVCVSVCLSDLTLLLENREEGLEHVRWMLRDPEYHLVFHNGAFDLAVFCAADESLIPLVFDAFEAGRIHDTMLREQLLDIAGGRRDINGKEMIYANGDWRIPEYGLAGLEKKYMNRDRSEQKKDKNAWRLRYAELEHLPVEQWPEDAVRYAKEDAEGTLEVFFKQAPGPDHHVVNEREQVYAAFCLRLISAWGMRTDPVVVEKLEIWATTEWRKVQEKMLKEGLFRIEKATKDQVEAGKIDFYGPRKRKAKKAEREAGLADEDGYVLEHDVQVGYRYVKDQAAVRARVVAAFEKLGVSPPLTDKGEIKADADVLGNCGDDMLTELGGGGKIGTVRNTFLPTLKKGLEVPVQTKFKCILNTGRISSHNPNLNNIPRGLGVREAFIPRAGFGFVSVDYDCAELRSHAQINYWLFGESEAKNFFNADPTGDPHLELAASILGISTDEAKTRRKAGDKDVIGLRQACKALNFGLPGGMGPDSLIDSARKGYGVHFTHAEAKERIHQWKQRWPEMKRYFEFITRITRKGDGDIEQMRPGGVPHRRRGGVKFSEAANTLFQGLTADAAKHALTQVMRECYVDMGTPLFGSRVVAFLYDEIIIEAPLDIAHEAAFRLSKVMCEAAQEWIPDVPITATPALMTRWLKGAEAVYDENGRLVPWEPPPAKVAA